MRYFIGFLCLLFVHCATAQQPAADHADYWNTHLQISTWRLPPPPHDYQPRLVDLDNDGDPDILYSVSRDSVPVLWIDDDDDMKWDDLEGDTDSDCLLIDRNRDGKYGHLGDLIIDWVDTDKDNKADMQVIVENPEEKTENPWPNGHYMWVLDTDKDNVFNYVNWNTFKIEAWARNGLSDFLLDYSGETAFIKHHVSTYALENPEINWENPFLFYDPDHDGLSEMAVRLVDSPRIKKGDPDEIEHQVSHAGAVDWVSISVDLDNDNAPGNNFDFDFTLHFKGKGFDYSDQVHKYENMRGLPEADTFFMDPRWRQMDELVYTDHDHALDFTFNRGVWDKVYFVYDEDDDGNRWERVELYDPKDVFNVGTRNKGLDDNPQSDVAGDRGEWDLDNSGGGKLYIGKFDGRIHLYGAEWGAWRIDQLATYYHAGDRKWQGGKEPTQFATVKYVDSDNNGFIDKMLYDLDGDKLFEDSVDFRQLGISDAVDLIDVSAFTYDDYHALQSKVADNLWKQGQQAVVVAEKFGLNTSWYAKLKESYSTRLKYNNGYWLQFYLYRDLKDLFMRKKDTALLKQLDKAYYTGDWAMML